MAWDTGCACFKYSQTIVSYIRSYGFNLSFEFVQKDLANLYHSPLLHSNIDKWFRAILRLEEDNPPEFIRPIIQKAIENINKNPF